ncbi:MAG: hypothetical protein KJZ85_08550 [Rhodobacteraceae bacterium]|jgi:hypothetical protein|nr:hypothetical protein [Paracoccaceae bacterium]
MRRRVHIRGERGRWVAEVEGRWLAVLHQTFRVGPHGYRAPIPPEHPGQKRFEELARALHEHDLVVVQRDRDPVTLARDGYVGVFRFKDLRVDTDAGEMSLTLTERHADPK